MSKAARRNTSLFQTLFLGGTCIAAGAGFGLWIPSVLPDQTLISFLKYSTVLLGIVWAFSMIVYNKLYDLTELAAIDSDCVKTLNRLNARRVSANTVELKAS